MTPPKRLRRLPPGGQCPRLRADLRRLGRAEEWPRLAATRPAGHASGRAEPDPRRSLGQPALAKTRARSQAGFTLVEVLVALALMAVLAGMAWQGLDGISRARTASQQRVEQTLRLNTVLAQWEQDLQSVFDTNVVPALAFDGATLRLVRRQPEGLQVVAWSLRDQRWLRWAGPVVTQAAALQESWLTSQQLLGNETAQLAMQGGLATWQVYFYRGNAWSNAQSSADVAAPAPPSAPTAPVATARTQLPTGVRIVLGLEGAGLAGNLTRDVLLGPQL